MADDTDTTKKQRGRKQGSKYASFQDLVLAVQTKDGMRKLMEEGKTLTPGVCRTVLPILEKMGTVPKEVKDTAAKAASGSSKAPPREAGKTYEDRVFMGKGDIPRMFLSFEPYEVEENTPVWTTYDKTSITISFKKPR